MIDREVTLGTDVVHVPRDSARVVGKNTMPYVSRRHRADHWGRPACPTGVSTLASDATTHATRPTRAGFLRVLGDRRYN